MSTDCSCIDQANELLAQQGMRVAEFIPISESLDLSRPRARIELTHISDKRRIKGSASVLVATHCPFCGRPY